MKMSNNIMKPVVNVFIFRRDLRVTDNTALALLCASSEHPILPIFIFNPIQVTPSKNKYHSANAVQFMVDCLKELRAACKDTLHFFHGYDISILDQLLREFVINAVGCNLDYTPFAKYRDAQLQKWCELKNIPFVTSEDYSLFKMGSILTESNKPYEVFTPFYRKCLSKVTQIPRLVTFSPNFYKGKVGNAIKNIDSYVTTNNKALAVHGGRENALIILKQVLNKAFASYDNVRDFPILDSTTKLSAYLKFGAVSVREVFDAFKKAYGLNHGLVRELIWREFYAHITYHFPKILNGQVGGSNEPFKDKYKTIQWHFDEIMWKRWCEGKTGYPMVDAGMRQMNAIGWMHNRCRMITSTFLTKDLCMDWRKGEQYFAKKLVDYDPCSNNGGWQWCSSTGTDSQPYFRVLSPILQAQRFDKNADFIKKWIPELKDVPSKDILKWEDTHGRYTNIGYPGPMVIHKDQVKQLMTFFKGI